MNTQHNHDLPQYYLDIIHCMPNIVYWVDLDCMLQGCNLNFVKLLGLKQLNNVTATPYELMIKHMPWSAERIEAFRLDDMAVLFSGESVYDVEEQPVYKKNGGVIYFQATRVPLFDADKQVAGMVVILVDKTSQKNMEERLNKVESDVHAKRMSHLPRVLIVEDSLIAQRVAEALFVALNAEVDIAASGDAAVMLFSPGKYDIVLMDIGLQDTSGYIVSKILREMEKNTGHHVPIIALTSYQADVVKHDCKDYFMEGVITKPLTSEQAMQLIQYYVYDDEEVVIEGVRRG